MVARSMGTRPLASSGQHQQAEQRAKQRKEVFSREIMSGLLVGIKREAIHFWIPFCSTT